MPDVEALDWVVNTELAPLVEGSPIVRRVLKFPRKHLRALPEFLRDLRSERYNVVIDLQGLLRSALIARFARLVSDGYVLGMSDAREGALWFYQKIAKVPAAHAILRYLAAAHLAGANLDLQLHFPLPAGEVPEGFSLSPEYILIHPFSRWLGKSLSADLVSELVKLSAPRRVVVVGQGSINLPDIAEDWTGRTSLKQLLGIIQGATGVISSDSGPLHLAVALGRPTVGVFGPSHPELTGPWASNSCAIRVKYDSVCRVGKQRAWKTADSGLDAIPAERIIHELHRMIGRGRLRPSVKLLLE